MTVSCPKCASRDARSLTLVSSRHALPPRRKHFEGWLLLTGVFAVPFIRSIAGPALITLILAGMVAVVGWMTWIAHAYNAHDLPVLIARWEQSVMCSRCGHVFAPRDQSELVMPRSVISRWH